MSDRPDVDQVGPLRAFVRRVPPLRSALLRAKRAGQRAAARTHLLELWVYSRSGLRKVLRPGEGPRIRFIIYGQGRSGSSVLLDLIGSHPDVYCESEIFNEKVAARLLRPWDYLQARAALSPKPAYGCKMKIYQMTDDQGIEDPRGFLQELHSEGWKVVHLVREDLFRKALSLVVAETRGQFLDRSSGGTGVDSISIDPERLVEAMRERRSADIAEQAALEGIPCVKVTYEGDLLEGTKHQEVSDRVLKYLGLESAPVQTRYVKTSRGSIGKYVANYPEVCAHVRGTEFASYLPSPEAT
jgi:hypothetical protein